MKHACASLDGSANGPDIFSGPIGKKLLQSVSHWLVNIFKLLSVTISSFPTVLPHVVNVLSTDQFYAYEICWTAIHVNVDTNAFYVQFLNSIASKKNKCMVSFDVVLPLLIQFHLVNSNSWGGRVPVLADCPT